LPEAFRGGPPFFLVVDASALSVIFFHSVAVYSVKGKKQHFRLP